MYATPSGVTPNSLWLIPEHHIGGWLGHDEDMLTPTGYPPSQHSSRHDPQHTQHTASTAATPRYPQARVRRSTRTEP